LASNARMGLYIQYSGAICAVYSAMWLSNGRRKGHILVAPSLSLPVSFVDRKSH